MSALSVLEERICEELVVVNSFLLSLAVLGAEVGAQRGRQVARRPRESRQVKPWRTDPGNAVPEPLLALQRCAGAGQLCAGRSPVPGPLSALRAWKWVCTRELWNFLVVVIVTETSPVHSSINTAPMSVYIMHSASSLAD